ncbi:MAG: hypothetical protein ABIO70_31880 [Pseudomonadota bacterium]
MSEGADSLQALGRDVIVHLHGLSRSVALYETNNNAVQRVLDALMATVEPCLRESSSPLSVRLLAEEFFVNGRLLKVDAQIYDRATDLARTLNKFKVGEVRMEPGLTRAQLDTFATDLAASVRAGESRLNPDGYGSLFVARSEGRSVASFRFQPHRLAKVLYGSELDLVEKLYAAVAAGERAPSLLALKRTLQLLIDAMADHGPMFQVLAAVHDPTRPVSLARRRVAAAVDAVGFGYYLGLPKADLMYLALGAILGGLSESLDPEEAIDPLFRFPGLGDSAMPLILAVRDARAVRIGYAAGVPGQMLAVVELYTELVTANEVRPAISPHQALSMMVGGQVPGVDRGAARVFADYKGPWPLGSAVTLNTGQLALVVAQPATAEGKQRPRVALLGRDGTLGRRVDLSEVGDIAISGAPAPAEIALNLAET